MFLRFSLNPLFEREWRGRFRRLGSHLQLALLVLLVMGLVCAGVQFIKLSPDLTVGQWRAHGLALLDTYRWVGAIVYWSGALLLGATSVSDEKAEMTWEHLLLCMVGGRGLAVGKVMSGAAWLLILQITIFPPLFIAGQCFGFSPLEIAGVMISHLVLTIQGGALGLWGALRGRTLVEGLAEALAGIGRIWGQCILVVVLWSWGFGLIGGLIHGLALIRIPVVSPFLSVLWAWLFALIYLVGKIGVSLVAGLTGIGVPLRSLAFVREWLLAVPVFLGQLAGIALFLKWSVWSIDHPTRDFWGVTPFDTPDHKGNDHLKILYRVWQWRLTPHQLSAFPLRETREPLGKMRDLLPSWEKMTAQVGEATQTLSSPKPSIESKAVRKNTKRLRAPVSRRLQGLNPVLWLDLTRCLSLRSPDSAMLPILLTIGALGGSLLFAISLFLLVGWLQTALGGARGDVSSMEQSLDQLSWVLRWAALTCGPLWGAMGYVIERRTGMLVELRLTLITALDMWMGKFGARFGIFMAFSLPVLALVAFFAGNWPGKSAPAEVAAALLSSWALGMWSVCACLWLSDSSRRDLTAGLWCAAFGLIWGALLWNFPTYKWTPMQLSWTHIHLLGAALAGGHLFWRLKRLGFG